MIESSDGYCLFQKIERKNADAHAHKYLFADVVKTTKILRSMRIAPVHELFAFA